MTEAIVINKPEELVPKANIVVVTEAIIVRKREVKGKRGDVGDGSIMRKLQALRNDSRCCKNSCSD